MSYCRRTWDGSDVYMFEHVGGYIECSGCPLPDQWIVQLDSVDDALAHITEHRAAGHVVPDYVDDNIKQENPWT